MRKLGLYMRKLGWQVLIPCCLLFTSAMCSSLVEEENPFWNGGIAVFDTIPVFDDERLPNIVVTPKGTVLATWGRYNYRVRRSVDGGLSWGEPILVGTGRNWVHGGGVTVNDLTGHIFVFLHHGDHTGNDTIVAYKSVDDGLSWKLHEVTIHPDIHGNMPTSHMAEHGITLHHVEHRGRLLRPARFFGRGNIPQYWPEHYNTAIFSDDGGVTWYTSTPFPALGTGEGALAELSDGRIIYNSRRHWAPEGETARRRHFAMSYDGGKTWEDLWVSNELPDGAQHVDYGLMGGMVRLPVDGHDILIFSNIDVPAESDDEDIPHHLRTTRRIRGTVWASFDGGLTWPVKRLVTEGRFGYSSLAAGKPGTPTEGLIFLLYESDLADLPNAGARLVRFNLAWLTEGHDWRQYLP